MPQNFWARSLRLGFSRKAARAAGRTSRKGAAGRQLVLEPLEDRLAPAVYMVTNSFDNNSPGSLRWAVDKANLHINDATDPSDSIGFDLGSGAHTILLTGGELSLTDTTGPTTIQGPGASLLTIDGNNTSRVFSIASGVTARLEELFITNGQATFGGGIWNDGGTLTVSDCILTNNAASYGGGILSSGELTVSACDLTGNSAQEDGGAMMVNRLTMSDSIVSSNKAFQGQGGGINGINLMVSNCILSDNEALQGGGIYQGGGVSMVSNCTLERNSASGGGVHPYSATGGGILMVNGLLTVSNSTLRDNSAGSYGGGIYFSGGTLRVSNSILESNTLGSNNAQGAGICQASGLLMVSDSTLRNNFGIFLCQGGGIFSHGPLTVTNSTIADNRAASGGGIYTDWTATVSGSTLAFNGNTLGDGGGICNNGGTLTVSNCTLTDNVAIRGGGIYNGGTLRVTNSTLTNGLTTAAGGGLFVESSSLATLNNTVVAGNLRSPVPLTPDDIQGSVSAASANNLVGTGGSGGLQHGVNGNIVGVTNPGLAPLGYYGGPTQTMPLLPGSPGFDAGNNALAVDAVGNPLATDQRGFTRVAGARVDIGAFEWHSGAMVVNTTADTPSTAPGQLSLRQAHALANLAPDRDTINFGLPASDPRHFYYRDDGVAGSVSATQVTVTNVQDDTALADIDPDWTHSWWCIEPLSALPAIKYSVLLDGYSQAGAQPNTLSSGTDAILRVELNGSSAGIANGLSIEGSQITVRGLAINGFRSGDGFTGGAAIHLSGSNGGRITGNFIGTDVSGTRGAFPANLTAPSPSLPWGIAVFSGSTNNVIGTNGDGVDDLAERNLVSSNGPGVILVSDSGTTVAGNLIGTDRTGTRAVGNWVGLTSLASSHDADIEGNVISGNRFGILLAGGNPAPAAYNYRIASNLIGTDANGTQPLGNLYAGVAVGIASYNSQITRNTIAYNGGQIGNGPGVWIADFRGSPYGIRVQGNSIHDNAGLGIDLGGSYPTPGPGGVTLNDSAGHNGPNRSQNFPELTAASGYSTSTLITGTFTSPSQPNTTLTLDFYANSSPGTPTGGQYYSEGETYLGSTVVTTDGSGQATFMAVVGGNLAGQWITSTATDSSGNTSEFSAAVQAADDSGSGQSFQNSLQAALPNSPGPNLLTLQASSQTVADAFMAVFSSTNTSPLTAPAGASTPISIQMNLDSSISVTEANLVIPAGFRVSINGGIWYGGSPALTLGSGDLTITGATFINDTDAPTILVSSGHLTLRDSVIQESTGYSRSAVQVTGGTVDLGTAADPGGNTMNVNGAGVWITDTSPNPVSAVGDAFRVDGVLLTAPVVGAVTAPTTPVQKGTAIGASAGFLGTGANTTHTATWDWGDGLTTTGTVTEAYGSGSVTGSHTYSATGVYTVTLKVTDSAGDFTQSQFQYVVVYDPSAGFVTGGGWINSPVGAYAANTSLTGKATFGFVSQYHNGATVPTGDTQFQFNMANFNFKSTSYDWLVISGAKARYRGTGTVNGVTGYGFELTAWDGQVNGGGGVDRFRIKIWYGSPRNVVYDNQMGADDGVDPITALGGGSIVIHK